MKFLAVICEYNPFHNGHAYQLKALQEQLACDGTICLMSGSFVQRGEPAMFNKWARSEMALACGADLVLELPALYSLQSAEGFASGAVSLLSSLGFEGYLGFGSETGNLGLLQSAAEISVSTAFQNELKEQLKNGISYPKAYGELLSKFLQEVDSSNIQSNDILGIEYCKALRRIRSKLQPVALMRKGREHDSLLPKDEYLSATGIRNRLQAGQDIESYVPLMVHQIIKREISAGRGLITPEPLGFLLSYVLQHADRNRLAHISGISEGLEGRLIEAGRACQSFDEIVQAAKTKRYPQTRIQRALINILLEITKEDEGLKPSYARILGIGEKGAAILRFLQKTTEIPFINKASDAKFDSIESERLFSIDCAATDLHALIYPQKKAGRSGMDFCHSPVLSGLK